MTIEQHGKNLGFIVVNLQSLEFLLRIFLNRLPGARSIGPRGTRIYELPVGTFVLENDITDYSTLGELIVRYNLEVSARRLGQTIQEDVVTLRDALAHGRVSTTAEDTTMRLLKFGRPKNGKVEIVFNELMDETWFEHHRKRIAELIRSVKSSIDKLPPPNPS